MKDKTTTIIVSMKTRDMLKKLGTKGDTYDMIIQKLMKHNEETR